MAARLGSSTVYLFGSVGKFGEGLGALGGALEREGLGCNRGLHAEGKRPVCTEAALGAKKGVEVL